MAERNLEKYRFAPTPESLTKIQELKRFVQHLRLTYPEIGGIAFFGSRTTGLEHKASDQDAVIFVDGTRFVPTQKPMDFSGGKLIVNPLAFPESRRLNEGKLELHTSVLAAVEEKMRELGLPIDKDDATGQNKTVSVVDISQKATDQILRHFMQSVDRDTNFGKQPLPLDQVGYIEFNLLSRFYLAVGQGIYTNRRYILDKLALANPRYFDALMQYLQYSERTKVTTKRKGLTAFNHYPATIADARKYFLTESAQ